MSLSREGVVADEGGVQKLNRYQIAREVVQEWARLPGLPLFERSVAIVIEKYCVQQMVDQQQAEPED